MHTRSLAAHTYAHARTHALPAGRNNNALLRALRIEDRRLFSASSARPVSATPAVRQPLPRVEPSRGPTPDGALASQAPARCLQSTFGRDTYNPKGVGGGDASEWSVLCNGVVAEVGTASLAAAQSAAVSRTRGVWGWSANCHFSFRTELSRSYVSRPEPKTISTSGSAAGDLGGEPLGGRASLRVLQGSPVLLCQNDSA